MSLVYTEGYLKSISVNSVARELEKNIENIFIVPPIKNNKEIILYIYDYDIYHPIYEIKLLNKEVPIWRVLRPRRCI